MSLPPTKEMSGRWPLRRANEDGAKAQVRLHTTADRLSCTPQRRTHLASIGPVKIGVLTRDPRSTTLAPQWRAGGFRWLSLYRAAG